MAAIKNCCCVVEDSREGRAIALMMLYGGRESGATAIVREGSGLY